MGGNYNWFGATAQDVVDRFKNGQYLPVLSEFGGAGAIEDIMDQCEAALESALGTTVFQQLIHPKLLCVVPRAFPGQTAFQIPQWALPIVPLSMSLWYGAPVMFQLEPRKRSEVGTSWGTNDVYRQGADWNDSGWSTGNFRLFELQVGQFEFDVNTGAGNILSPVAPMVQDNVVYVTFDVNYTDPTYGLKSLNPLNNKSLLSLASTLVDGVAAIMGPNLYGQQGMVGEYIDRMEKRFQRAIDEFTAEKRIVSELRQCRWWTPLEKVEENGCESRRVFRS